jgi:hypothetical protein
MKSSISSWNWRKKGVLTLGPGLTSLEEEMVAWLVAVKSVRSTRSLTGEKSDMLFTRVVSLASTMGHYSARFRRG